MFRSIRSVATARLLRPVRPTAPNRHARRVRLRLEELEPVVAMSGVVPETWTGPSPIPGHWGDSTQEVAVAAGNLDTDSRPDVIIIHADNPAGANTLFLRVGHNLDAAGNVTGGWTDADDLPLSIGTETQGVGAAVADVDRNGVPDLIVLHVDNASRANVSYLSVGWNLNAQGQPTGHLRSGQPWTGPSVLSKNLGEDTPGAGIAVTSTGDRVRLYAYHIDNAIGDNHGYLQISDQFSPGGGATSSHQRLGGSWGHETQGADIAVADLGRDGSPNTVTIGIDNPAGENRGYFRVDTGDLNPIPGWWGHESQGVGLALADLNGNGRPEMIVVHLDNPRGGNTGYLRVGFDLGPPPPPPPAIIIDDATVIEGDAGTAELRYTVRLVTPSVEPVSVRVTTAGGTARPGQDYEETAATLLFAPGQTSQDFAVRVTGDTATEGDEKFAARLSEAVNATLLRAVATGTIVDDDRPLPTVSIAGKSVPEGNSGTTTATFTVTLSEPSVRLVSVVYQTADGNAQFSTDYQATSGSVTFLPGETQRTFDVTVFGDTRPEENEKFFVDLSLPTNATIAAGRAVGEIRDDDGGISLTSVAVPAVSVRDAFVHEGDTGSAEARFVVELSEPSSRVVSVGYLTQAGTARADTDFEPESGRLRFAPGETRKVVVVQVRGDRNAERDETFALVLSGLENATIARGRGTASIRDDDSPPRVSLHVRPVTEGDTGRRRVVFTVTIPRPSTKSFVLDIDTADGTARAGQDYRSVHSTLRFAPGETVKTVVVTVMGDRSAERDETFFLYVRQVGRENAEEHRITATIRDDDR